jgi:hypothetical protein
MEPLNDGLKCAVLLVLNGRLSMCQFFLQNLFAVAYAKVSYVAGVKVLNKSKGQRH